MALDHVLLTQKTAKFSNQEVVSYFKLLEDRYSTLRVPVNKTSLRTTFQILMYAWSLIKVIEQHPKRDSRKDRISKD